MRTRNQTRGEREGRVGSKVCWKGEEEGEGGRGGRGVEMEKEKGLRNEPSDFLTKSPIFFIALLSRPSVESTWPERSSNILVGWVNKQTGRTVSFRERERPKGRRDETR